MTKRLRNFLIAVVAIVTMFLAFSVLQSGSGSNQLDKLSWRKSENIKIYEMIVDGHKFLIVRDWYDKSIGITHHPDCRCGKEKRKL